MLGRINLTRLRLIVTLPLVLDTTFILRTYQRLSSFNHINVTHLDKTHFDVTTLTHFKATYLLLTFGQLRLCNSRRCDVLQHCDLYAQWDELLLGRHVALFHVATALLSYLLKHAVATGNADSHTTVCGPISANSMLSPQS